MAVCGFWTSAFIAVICCSISGLLSGADEAAASHSQLVIYFSLWVPAPSSSDTLSAFGIPIGYNMFCMMFRKSLVCVSFIIRSIMVLSCFITAFWG